MRLRESCCILLSWPSSTHELAVDAFSPHRSLPISRRRSKRFSRRRDHPETGDVAEKHPHLAISLPTSAFRIRKDGFARRTLRSTHPNLDLVSRILGFTAPKDVFIS